jgi:hypothetical protein
MTYRVRAHRRRELRVLVTAFGLTASATATATALAVRRYGGPRGAVPSAPVAMSNRDRTRAWSMIRTHLGTIRPLVEQGVSPAVIRQRLHERGVEVDPDALRRYAESWSVVMARVAAVHDAPSSVVSGAVHA